MAASTTKKAVIQRFDRESLYGYVNPVSFLQPGGVELLSLEGNIAYIPYDGIKTIAFVRDFTPPDQVERRAFQTRPKMEGLWVILRFRDGDALEFAHLFKNFEALALLLFVFNVAEEREARGCRAKEIVEIAVHPLR